MTGKDNGKQKGGTAELRRLKYDIYTTLKTLKDYYQGKSSEERRN
ncbi:MAG: hypothetical protein ACD_50C00191G0003 [uncultured bacterium]|nr:MAG: hypothetical protein ACD_50C00191G0003 [uncultured bacterium]KKQ96684.1 MAG: hypothetical protein UT20_C0004G0012 [Candidatus Levybacteria bacterium GW2011_GWA1_39_11]KKR24913.1 MAG: hypothetical protein UT56_C0006G0010 [Candidatus Levybacteria bacterium GW2011_GWB1_39_7]KKR26558.1 MAG: hypothetical protein UT57_C0031G0004 [Microgenomates group bacterium GW2011_GWC1_39_7]KKR49939.1 MAG: hypothetical protein UT85_C0008G0010 [Candidatus Levybacteria bacterium GW2011_GWA2_40_16]